MLRVVFLLVLEGCGRISFDALGNRDGGRPADGAITFGDGITTTMNIMFVTSGHQNAADLLAPEGGDAICGQDAYGWQLPGTYVAWLSSANRNMRDLFANSRGWVRTDGRVFAESPAALFAGQIQSPPVLDETANDVRTGTAYPATTATDRNGMFVGSDCDNYTSPSMFAVAGDPSSTGPGWTEGPTEDCGGNTRLYCFAIDP